ncbi:ABC transporter substrate-binding protein [Photobacterium sp. MCCC 1A19761]|uniref:siderophore ABC transporter substrate-binding protein n=1 Tax=Photobacterium sp. MCCC 1A19761 TaxID=3115000 RepID=UPI00307F94F5
MKKLSLLLVTLCCLFSTVRYSYAFPLTVEHAQGTTVITQLPKRVAVFDLASLDTMDALGVSAAGVPNANAFWPDYLKRYSNERYAKVGSLFDPDFDALKTLQPDLIIVSGRSRAAYPALSQLAPTIDLSLGDQQFVPGMQRNISVLGEIFDKQDKAQELNTTLDKALASLKGQAPGTGLVLFTMKEHIIAHAPGERFGMLYDLTGLTPIVNPAPPSPRAKPGSEAAKAQQEARKLRLTTALDNNPDWLVVLDRGAATGGEGIGAQTLAGNAQIANSKAWQAKHVYYLNPRDWYLATGGYQSVTKALNELQARFAD